MSGIGIDFGTTNSAIARADASRQVRVAQFQLAGEVVRVFRSILFFESERDWVAGYPPAWCGPEAIENYISCGADGRLMQSLKSFLANRNLRATNVLSRDFTLERLVATIISTLCRQSEAQLGSLKGLPISVGRPVRFAYSADKTQDDFAEERLRKAFAMAGLEDIRVVHEPVAAAMHYEVDLDHDEVVLVADFGGGTSDFSLLRVGPGHRTSPADSRIIGTAGVGVAGDTLDARLVDHLVAPQLGKGGRYRDMTGKHLEFPQWIFRRFKRWHELSILKSQKNMDMLNNYLRSALDPEPIDALIQLVEHDHGYAMSRAVERTKIALTDAEETLFEFVTPEVELRAPVTRAQFNEWIAPDIAALESTVDGLLTEAGVTSHDVDAVFLTGGTGYVPAIRALFADRFGQDKLRTGDFLASVAAGLALHASSS